MLMKSSVTNEFKYIFNKGQITEITEIVVPVLELRHAKMSFFKWIN